MVGLFNKDTMESVEDYDEANMKHIDELEKNSDWHEEAVNTTLEFISVATRNIKKGEEICDTYGGGYWFNGKVNQHQMANLDRSNRGRVKKFKKKRKEFETFRKEAWYQMLDVTAKAYEEETMEQIQAELKDHRSEGRCHSSRVIQQSINHSVFNLLLIIIIIHSNIDSKSGCSINICRIF